MKETEIICDRCGCVILDEESIAVDDDLLCQECHDRYCTSCDHCGRNVYLEDAVSDDYTALCTGCYNEHYTRCDDCNIIIAEADAYELHGYDYCRNCYNERCEDDEGEYIHEYGYKPDPIFYGDGNSVIYRHLSAQSSTFRIGIQMDICRFVIYVVKNVLRYRKRGLVCI